ncbi:hypothetical protein WH47_05535 [Habropoda laboriosa]|uniref:Uncharacterized protein n=1 Tax=Habropoda laboriosa TaxID=597456 RepID=A0A0L7RF30_9HYME|nr:PREDICTED: putative eggshell protein [Habropoda laboriosa]KOC69592.1 hypothetical protein WH47_05535 [Habropoda laboriosa]
MFAVRGAPFLLILLAILAPARFASGINHGNLELAATSGSHRYEEGGGSDRYASHEDKAGNRADKGYSGHHGVEEANRGHRSSNQDYGYYNEDGGAKSDHLRNDGYYDEHHEGETSEKGEGFQEKGHYGKGHSTHGHHEVKNLDEFEKHKEFHDEDYDSAFDEQNGGHHYDREQDKGGHYRGGYRDYGEQEADYGKKDYYLKGHYDRDHTGQDSDDAREDYYRNDYRHGKKGSHGDGKKWGYRKGH